MAGYKPVVVFCLVAQLICSPSMLCQPAVAVDSPVKIEGPANLSRAAINQAAKNKAMLSVTGRDIAEQLGVVELINEIVDVRAQVAENNGSPMIALKYLELKQRLLQKVMIASLQVRDATARIDKEITSMNRLNGLLEDKRDRALRTNSIANIFGNGAIMEIGQAGEMKTNEIPGETTELVGGGIVVLLGALSLMQQNAGTRQVHAKPNMLAKVLSCPTDKDSDYSNLIWTYLNRPEPGSASIKTRLQILIEQWQQYKTIGPLNNGRSRSRLYALSGSTGNGKVTLDLLGDRMDMLNDVKAEIFQMDRDLLELLLNVQSL